jgi:maltooligosyltrehalose synthase
LGKRDKRLEYSGVVEPILNYLNSLPNSKAINIHGSIFSERGTPDVLGCIQGRMVAFECKRDTTEDLEKIQKWRLCEWIHAGAIVGGVSSVDHVILILQLMGVIENARE